MNESTHNTEIKNIDRRNSDVRRMINDIENRHVRILNNNTDVRQHRVPIPRVQKSLRVKRIQEQMFGCPDQRLHLSEPSLVQSVILEERSLSTIACGDNLNENNFKDHSGNPEVHIESPLTFKPTTHKHSIRFQKHCK